KYLEEIVAGCEMDLTNKSYDTFAELETYCYRVASCVGLVSLHLFGVELTSATQQAGIALGKALQLTNILRDIATDLRRDRVYLPQEDLTRFQIGLRDLAHPDPSNLNLFDMLYFEMERARGFYRQAWEGFPKTGKARRRLAAAFSMGRIYETLLDKIAKDPISIFKEKVRLSRAEKLKIAGREIFKCLLPI
ncbi:MAG: squalene/phytoene synthase family protein, partial [Deltaproteobacteria bacterium]|nr:squalene/phytoene synthase family protein [Deltaproteobacteria bacterium]